MPDQLPPQDPPVRLLAAFAQTFPAAEMRWMVCPPGRAMWAAAGRIDHMACSIALPDQDARATFSLQSARLYRTVLQRPLPRWARYPAGVLLALDALGLEAAGLQVVIVGDEPPGPRFDYGLGMAVAALGHLVHEQPYSADRLIEIVDQARRAYVEGG